MDWHDFILGAISSMFTFIIMTSDKEEVVPENEPEENEELEVHDFKSRHVTLSCQSCRKLKKHKEVKPNLFQCVKCKRHVDLRAS
jgi:acetyl-CoA carboxylase beta subunit